MTRAFRFRALENFAIW